MKRFLLPFTVGFVCLLIIAATISSNRLNTKHFGFDGATGNWWITNNFNPTNINLSGTATIYGSSTINALVINTNQVVVTNNNVGIGTATPALYGSAGNGLAVGGPGARNFITVFGAQTGSDGSFGDLNFFNNGTRMNIIQGIRVGADNSSDMSFLTTSAGSILERFRITANGFNAVGTGMITGSLDIGVAASSFIDAYPVYQAAIYGSLATPDQLLLVNNGAVSRNVGITFYASGSGDARSYNSGHIMSGLTGAGTGRFVTIGSATSTPGTYYDELTVKAGQLAVNGNVTISTNLFVTNGIASYASNGLASAVITVTASPFNWTNNSGKNVFVFVDGVSVTGTTAINGDVIFNTIGQNTVPLQPTEWTTITYTIGTPTAKWRPR